MLENSPILNCYLVNLCAAGLSIGLYIKLCGQTLAVWHLADFLRLSTACYQVKKELTMPDDLFRQSYRAAFY